MGFANPAVLWLLAVLPLLWLRRVVPRTRMPVGALHLWRAAAPDRISAAPRRPRADLLVALRTAAAAALIIALAGPALPLPGRRVALVVDISASMGARDGDARRLDSAARRALELIDDLPLLTEVNLLTAATVPSVLGSFRATDTRLRQALADLEPAIEEADLDAAVARAATGGADHTFVVTDHSAPAEIDRAAVTWVPVGSPAENVAISNLSYATRADSPGTQVLVSVINFGDRPSMRELVLSPSAGPPSRERLSLAPGERVTLVRPVSEAAARVTAALDGSDALASDDTRVLDIAPAATRRVQLLNASPALDRAIRALPRVAIVDGNADVVVCGRCTSPPTRANVLLVPPPDGTAVVGPLLLTATTHPVGAALNLEGLRTAVTAAGPAMGGTVIAVAGGAPAVVAAEADGWRIVELRMDLASGPLTLDPAFPILIANAVEWLDPSATEASAGGVPSGESDLRVAGATIAPSEAPPAAAAVASDATLLFLVAALLLVAAEWLVAHRRHRVGRRPVAALPRAAAVAALVLGIAGVQIPGGLASVTSIVVLDRSASMGSEARALARMAALASGRRDGDRLGVVVFGATAGIERPPAAVAALPAITSNVERGGTNIEAGLRTARAALTPAGSRRLVLISDGRQTRGDAMREAARAAREGIRIDIAPPGWLSAEARPLTVTRLHAPAAVQAGEPFQVTATIEGSPGTRGDLVVRRDGTALGSVPVAIPAAGITTIALDDRQTATGPYQYDAAVTRPDDDFGGASLEPDAAAAVVVVTGAPRVLHVGARSLDLGRLLSPAGFRTDAVQAASLPRTAGALSSYDAIVLDDVAGDEMDAAQGAALAEYVEQAGGGLLILGSPGSLEPGLGGQVALSAIAPVDFRPRGGRRAPTASVVVVFDKSGSMADLVDGAPKIEYARQAVEGVMQAVSPADLVGVIAFDAAAVPVIPLEPGHTPESVKTRLRATTPAGATAIGPALELARTWLQAPSAAATARRHVLLLSDGRTSVADAQRALAVASTGGIEISTVALDAGSDRDLLLALAERSSGRAYFPADVRALPRLLAREASRVTGGRIVDDPFAVRIAPHAVTSGFSEGPGPRLGGYVVGATRPGAEVALSSPLNDPILATARAGLGRVGIYTADLRSAWSEELRAWRRFPALLTQTVRWVSRRTSTAGLFASVQATDAGMRLTVETEIPDIVGARVDIRRPGSEQTETMTLDPIVPGRFDAFIAAAVPGPYLFAVTAIGAGSDARLVRGYAWTAQRELVSTGVDMTLLTGIARTTGGRILAESDSAFSAPRERAWIPARPWLAAAALVVLLSTWLSPVVADLLRRLAASRRASLTASPGTA